MSNTIPTEPEARSAYFSELGKKGAANATNTFKHNVELAREAGKASGKARLGKKRGKYKKRTNAENKL